MSTGDATLALLRGKVPGRAITVEDTLDVAFRYVEQPRGVKVCTAQPAATDHYTCHRPRGHHGPHVVMRTIQEELYRWVCNGPLWSYSKMAHARVVRQIHVSVTMTTAE